jgi:hypothetical protein
MAKLGAKEYFLFYRRHLFEQRPDFVAADVEYTDIEVIVEMDGDIRDTVQLVETLERPLKERK